MAHVHVAPGHRSDHAEGFAVVGLSLSLAVIDVEPRADAGGVVDGGCASCSFKSFLESRDDLARYRGLAPILGVLKQPRHRRSDGTVRLPPAPSGSSVYRLGPGGRADGDRVLHLDHPETGAWPTIREEDAVLLRPDGRGPAHLFAQLGEARRAGAQQILLGYARHTDAVDHWPQFLEHPDLGRGWLNMLAEAHQLGFAGLGFAMAYPPCATLQWPRNRVLESLRARLDLQFRRLDGEASMMCPENVSGYSLLNDTREAMAAVAVATSRFAIHTGDALIVY